VEELLTISNRLRVIQVLSGVDQALLIRVDALCKKDDSKSKSKKREQERMNETFVSDLLLDLANRVRRVHRDCASLS
jgi:hypothetical protein